MGVFSPKFLEWVVVFHDESQIKVLLNSECLCAATAAYLLHCYALTKMQSGININSMKVGVGWVERESKVEGEREEEWEGEG